MTNPIKPKTGQLINEKCTACNANSVAVSDEELKFLLPVITDWKLIEENGTKKLDRLFQFSTFKDAMAFTNKIASLAEEEGHHPRIVTEWGAVRVTWWTHKIRNLHRNDFLMAIKSTNIFENL